MDSLDLYWKLLEAYAWWLLWWLGGPPNLANLPPPDPYPGAP